MTREENHKMTREEFNGNGSFPGENYFLGKHFVRRKATEARKEPSCTKVRKMGKGAFVSQCKAGGGFHSWQSWFAIRRGGREPGARGKTDRYRKALGTKHPDKTKQIA